MKMVLVGAIGMLGVQVLLVMGAYMMRFTPEVINCDRGRQSATVRVSVTFPDVLYAGVTLAMLVVLRR